MKDFMKSAQSRGDSGFARVLTMLAMMLLFLTTGATSAMADNVVVLKVDPVTVANGSEAEIEVKMDYTTEKTLVGLSFSLYLPDGILLKGFDTKEAQDAAKASALKKACDLGEDGVWGDDDSSGWLTVKQKDDGGLLFTFIDQDDKTEFENTHAPVISVYVHAVADVANVNGTINGIKLTDNANNTIDNIAEVTIPFNASAPETVDVTGVTLSSNMTTLTEGGEAIALTPTVNPSDATDKTVKWSVSQTDSYVGLYTDASCNTAVGSDAIAPNAIYVKPLAVGSATITVTTNDGAKKATCVVIVEESWTELVINGNMEGSDVSCFYVHEQGKDGTFLAPIYDGIGVDDSRAIKVQSADNPSASWDTQFYVRLPYVLPPGTRFTFSFDCKVSSSGDFEIQTHKEPGQYVCWKAVNTPQYINGRNKYGSFDSSKGWEHFAYGYSVPQECDGSQSTQGNWLNKFQTIAFSLAGNSVATEFIFDNVKFEVPTSMLNTLTAEPVTDPELMIAYPPYKVSLAEGTKDADKWTITPAEATTTGVDKGTEVKATYNGTKRVKSVKAEVKDVPGSIGK